jgi:hypothetical protein
MKAKIGWLLLPILALTACATPETRLRNGLASAGLPNPVAACMADRMIDRLSLLQLRRLAALGSLSDRPLRELTPEQFLRKVRALKDVEILAITTSSAALCAFG